MSPSEVAEQYAQTGFECSEERIIAIENQEEPIKDYEVFVFERIFGGSEITQFFSQELEARLGKKGSWKPL